MIEKNSPYTFRRALLNGILSIDDLTKHKDSLYGIYKSYISGSIPYDDTQVYNLIMLYLDYYTYSENGDVLITDREYDSLTELWKHHGGSIIQYADNLINQTQWELVPHEFRGMVGTVKKAYTRKELEAYLNVFRSIRGYWEFIIAPKFDGVSSAIKVDRDGKILKAVTRYDGVRGQDITRLVRNAENADDIGKYFGSILNDDGGDIVWVKTELCVRSYNFETLCEEKPYKNRRSATSGIINSPKNIHLAKYITIIPLAYCNLPDDEIIYDPLDNEIVKIGNIDELMEVIEKKLSIIRSTSYDFRVDGVVIYPYDSLGYIVPNMDDIMDYAIAYKVNTAVGRTTIDYGYVSVGRLGNAVPMLHVHPVEVNETTVTDVSLGSFDKFVNMDLHEGEEVEVFSAGDVIPQARIPEVRKFHGHGLLQIPKKCPYCNKKLSRYQNSYRCENPECPRVASGKIANFLVKLKADGVSDKTVEDLFEHHLIEDIPDLFDLEENQISSLSGYGKDSARLIINEIRKIQNKEIPVSSFLGALGIQGISTKKCRKLLSVMTLDKMLDRKPEKLKWDLINAEGINQKTSDIFVDWLIDNRKLIKRLMDKMNVVRDTEWKGNVVFTGFRDPELEAKFNKKGYEISDNVNSDTAGVIDASYEHGSTKAKAAIKKGIPLMYIDEAEEFLKQL